MTIDKRQVCGQSVCDFANSQPLNHFYKLSQRGTLHENNNMYVNCPTERKRRWRARLRITCDKRYEHKKVTHYKMRIYML